MKIAIIGGGLSGSLVAINLMRLSKKQLSISLFEKNMGQMNRGVAYSSALPYQLLNVPVKDMSLFGDMPGHFMDWLQLSGYEYKGDDFAPRDVYGHYIADTFSAETLKTAHHLAIIPAEVKSVTHKDGMYSLTTHKNETFVANKVVLCTGNFPPGDIPGLPQDVKKVKSYVGHPWGGFYISTVNSKEDILMVGSGLTMIDMVLSLNQKGHKGKITVISRRGMLPLPHGDALDYNLSRVPSGDLSVSQLMDWVKDEIAKAEKQGKNWRSVANAVRDHIPQLWRGLSLEEKRRFMRHLRPFWEIHRHRMPAESLDILNRMKQEGRLELIAGRINGAEVRGETTTVKYRCRNSKDEKQITVNRIINCTGPETEYRKMGSSLYQSLVENKLAQPDVLALGLKANADGFVIDETGNVNTDMALIGPPAKGVLWECTALREIRQQAALVAEKMLKG
jgi:uncharacterized NAD(P)/FAD-binding protein YdhS